MTNPLTHLAAIILGMMLALTNAPATPQQTDTVTLEPRLYNLEMVVTRCPRNPDIEYIQYLELVDEYGEAWYVAAEDGDWFAGDHVIVTLCDLGTETWTDDCIINMRYIAK